MILKVRGKTRHLAPFKLLFAAGLVSAGLFVAMLALTNPGGPGAFFNMQAFETATRSFVESFGIDTGREVAVAAEGAPRGFVTSDYKIEDAGFWSSWYLTIPMLVVCLGAAGAALFMARKFHFEVKAREPGTPKMIEIADAVREGAFAYLKRQRAAVVPVLVGTAIVIALINAFGMAWWLSIFVFFGLLTGGACSFVTGWFGMNTATIANCRTAYACTKEDGLNQGLQVAFRAGAVMGLSVVGVGLAFVTLWLFVLGGIFDAAIKEITLNEVANAMITFGLGASLVALFARVGGGIYTKAADVGADLVGKVEAGIPEDDPRNPATIADNVGDNVGDVAGMGADLYESYVGSILACLALSWSAASSLGRNPWAFAVAPLLIAAGGIILSLVGTKFVKTKEGATLGELLAALNKGVHVASIGIVPIVLIVSILCFGWMFWGMFLATCIGLGSGLIIAWACGKYTGYDFKPTQDVALQSQTGPATVIIGGLAVGMMSTWIPILTVCVATILAFGFGGGFVEFSAGVYAVSLAAVGMLCTLGITLATDAYGPIADNAGGNAEMAGLPPEVREKTDALDALGNTTAAIGKGFAIGSAALTALGLIAAYQDSMGSVAGHMQVKLNPMQMIMNTSVMSPGVIIGLFLGALLVFVFCALTMKAVGDAAKDMVEEVRRQFREIPGLREGKEGVKPEHAKCVDISTQAALQKMKLPAIIAVVGPILTGVFFGSGAVFGLLAGGLAAGFAMGVMMANAGGSWDNAKKWIEKGGLAEHMIALGKYNPEIDDKALEPVKTSGGAADDGGGKKKKKGKKAADEGGAAEGGEEAAPEEKKEEKKKTTRLEKADEIKPEAEPEIKEPEIKTAEVAMPATPEKVLEAVVEPKGSVEARVEPKMEVPPTMAEPPKPAPAPKKKYARYMKGSLEHKAAVVGDTVGDPFKDTSGPSLNILVKLMSMVAVATVALTLFVNKGGGVLSWFFELIFKQ
ncbi:MAG: sodium-translocating pyrophosphatase [Planctomycetes bacterium]|nr:sodium-translocating pyrophosphatase [Planctomycetota bacterium]